MSIQNDPVGREAVDPSGPTKEAILDMVEAAYNTGFSHGKTKIRTIFHHDGPMEDGAVWVRRRAAEILYGGDDKSSTASRSETTV